MKRALILLGCIATTLGLAVSTAATASAYNPAIPNVQLMSYYFTNATLGHQNLNLSCMVPTSGAHGARVRQAPCTTGADTRWDLSNAHASPIVSHSAPDRCLDTRNGQSAWGVGLVIGHCTGSATQSWTVYSSMSLEGDPFQLLRNDGVSARLGSDYCITAYALSDYGDYLYPCWTDGSGAYGSADGAPNQVFQFPRH